MDSISATASSLPTTALTPLEDVLEDICLIQDSLDMSYTIESILRTEITDQPHSFSVAVGSYTYFFRIIQVWLLQ